VQRLSSFCSPGVFTFGSLAAFLESAEIPCQILKLAGDGTHQSIRCQTEGSRMAYNSIISVQAVYSPPVTLQTTSGILEPWTYAVCARPRSVRQSSGPYHADAARRALS
jgi:hypothetical protein